QPRHAEVGRHEGGLVAVVRERGEAVDVVHRDARVVDRLHDGLERELVLGAAREPAPLGVFRLRDTHDGGRILHAPAQNSGRTSASGGVPPTTTYVSSSRAQPGQKCSRRTTAPAARSGAAAPLTAVEAGVPSVVSATAAPPFQDPGPRAHPY